jgi:hypothetical protein
VSNSGPTDHARGWLYAEGLLLEDAMARLEGMREEELDDDLRRLGVNPGRLPSLETLLGRAAALATQEAQDEVDHARGWAHVESLFAEDETAVHDAGGVPSLERLLARAAELAEEAPPIPGVAVAVEARAPEEAPPVKARMAVRRLRAVWLAAAMLAALLLVLALMNGAAIVAAFKGDTIRPDDDPHPWKSAPTREERATSVREQALAACDEARWTACAAKLDEARAMDPAGESAPRVAAARKAMADAAKTPPPREKPAPLKAPPVP